MTSGSAEGLFALIASDLRAKSIWLYGGLSRRNLLKALVTDGTFAMIVYRLMQASHRLRLTPFAMIFNKINVVFGGCTIGRGAWFGPGFVLIHSRGVVINTAVVGGCDVKLEHGVTIGAEAGAVPCVGDNVFVGAGAKIIGKACIGDGAKIGANAVVLDEIPAGATAVGIPAKVVKMHDADTS
jgi:serine O-acetyltransferase